MADCPRRHGQTPEAGARRRIPRRRGARRRSSTPAPFTPECTRPGRRRRFGSPRQGLDTGDGWWPSPSVASRFERDLISPRRGETSAQAPVSSRLPFGRPRPPPDLAATRRPPMIVDASARSRRPPRELDGGGESDRTRQAGARTPTLATAGRPRRSWQPDPGRPRARVWSVAVRRATWRPGTIGRPEVAGVGVEIKVSSADPVPDTHP